MTTTAKLSSSTIERLWDEIVKNSPDRIINHWEFLHEETVEHVLAFAQAVKGAADEPLPTEPESVIVNAVTNFHDGMNFHALIKGEADWWCGVGDDGVSYNTIQSYDIIDWEPGKVGPA